MNNYQADPESRRWLVPLVRLLAKLPLPALYLIADILFILFFYLLRIERKLVEDNLCKAFPDRPAGDIRRLAGQTYRNTITVTFEGIKALEMSRQDLERRVEISNPEIFDELLRHHKTVIAITSHYANWEWLQLACSSRLEIPIAALYSRLNLGSIDSLLLQMRSRFGSTLIEARSALPELMKLTGQGGIIAINADQGPRPDEEKYWGRLLGLDTAFFTGAEKLAQLFRAPVVFVHMQPLKRGYYRIRFELLTEPAYRNTRGEIMEPYIRAVERQILDNPRYWVWVYKRWKYAKSLYDN